MSAWVWVNSCQCWLFAGRKRRALVYQNVLTLKWHGIWRSEAGKILDINPRKTAMEAMRALPVRADIPIERHERRPLPLAG